MKKIAVFFLSLVFLAIFSFASFADASNAKKENISMRSDIIANFEVGDPQQDLKIGYISDEEGHAGPEAFCKYDDTVYVVDTINNRIVSDNNGVKRAFSTDYCKHPSYICANSSHVYVSGNESEDVFVLTMDGNLEGRIILPDEIKEEGIYQLIVDYGNDELTVLTDDLTFYKYFFDTNAWEKEYSIQVTDKGNAKTYTFPNMTFSLDVEDNSIVRFLDIDEYNEHIYVGVYECDPLADVFTVAYSVRTYSTKGELLACYYIDEGSAFSHPLNNVFIEDETVYAMMCEENGVSICRPYAENENNRHFLSPESSKNDEESTRSTTPLTSYTRDEMRERAVKAATLRWILKNGNKTPLTDVDIPPHISGADYGDIIEGVPYCWGKFHSTTRKFLDKRDAGYTTGNISSTDVSGTAGFDCSGYVSYVLGFTGHHGTGILIGEGYSVSHSTSNLHTMDFLIHLKTSTENWAHVILFDQVKNSTTVWIYDCTKNSINKVTRREVTISYLSGYSFRTPYYCGKSTTNCSYSSTYSYDDDYHWKPCIYGCGNKGSYQAHTWVTYGVKLKCSVCGFITDPSVVIDKTQQKYIIK